MQNIPIEDFNYTLPDDRIAKHPLKNRILSKLLVYNNQQITDSSFNKIADHLHPNDLMFFNNTKVIQARLTFYKATGAKIELLCLEPAEQIDVSESLMATDKVVWNCMIGNAKKWKEEILELSVDSGNQVVSLFAQKIAQNKIKFSWNNTNFCFGEILDMAGKVPLPPYLNRQADNHDKEVYQTVYAKNDGSVAAPTAGLHFTDDVIKNIQTKGIKTQNLTLHVGAGTFAPVKADNAAEHNMHEEYITFSKENLESILNNEGRIISVGTTSLRTLESIYWLGCKLIVGGTCNRLEQWENIELAKHKISIKESVNALIEFMQASKLNNLSAYTCIMITPGYDFKIISGLITNFHQPKSTLLLLVSALIGNSWKTIYNHALANNYRFLSFGDGSILTKD